MNSAAALIFALPQWYFGMLLAPLGAGALSIIPALGACCGLAGLVLGIWHRDARLFWFTAPAVASQALIAVAGFFHGQFRGEPSDITLCLFLIAQLAAAFYLVYRLDGRRLAALLLAVFSLTYSLFAAFVAAMAFSDNWI
ncbi:hypothetical protein [Sphingomonas sp.]|jgi:hypothetical protein|uniref:hypothetical protein n=1 Tax=Sphingomonas sp. TaxID=28214 RepID=UPI00356A29F7